MNTNTDGVSAMSAELGGGTSDLAGAVLVNKETREGVMFYSQDMLPDPAEIKDRFELVPVYTRSQREPLTDEQIELLFKGVDSEDKGRFAIVRGFARAIEAAHGIKPPNTSSTTPPVV